MLWKNGVSHIQVGSMLFWMKCNEMKSWLYLDHLWSCRVQLAPGRQAGIHTSWWSESSNNSLVLSDNPRQFNKVIFQQSKLSTSVMQTTVVGAGYYPVIAIVGATQFSGPLWSWRKAAYTRQDRDTHLWLKWIKQLLLGHIRHLMHVSAQAQAFQSKLSTSARHTCWQKQLQATQV